MPATDRIEKKIDSVESDLRGLTQEMHALRFTNGKLSEQLKNLTEAAGRAHLRIDLVDARAEKLQEVPTRLEYLEKAMKHQRARITDVEKDTASNSHAVTKATAVGATLVRFSIWLTVGAVAAALAVLGSVGKAIGSG